MDKCGRLTNARNLYAWFDNATKTVHVSADVELNPYTTEARICPNPLSRITPPPDAREFLVEAVEKNHGRIVPLPVLITRVYYSFRSDATPAKVRLYTMGVDNPASTDVEVASAPPPALFPLSAPTANAAPAGGAPAPAPIPPVPAPVEGVGFSQAFSFEEAIQAALADLHSKRPVTMPDAATSGEVVKIFARVGGNIRPGVEITIRG
jgi:hypothetical protein